MQEVWETESNGGVMDYFKVHRKLLDSPVFAHPQALKIWIWCLAKATYKKRYISVKVGKGETVVELQPGQFIFGRHKAEEALDIPGSTIYRWMEKFQDVYDMVTLEADNQYTIVSICNWAEYQNVNEESEQPTDSQRTTNEPDMNQTWATFGHKQERIESIESIEDSTKNSKSKIQPSMPFLTKEILGGGGEILQVNKMKQPLTSDQFDTLVSKYGVETVTDVLMAMENKAKVATLYVSTYLTADNWCKRRKSDQKQQPQPTLKKTVTVKDLGIV